MTQPVRPLLGVLAAFALGAGAACSGTGGDVASSIQSQSPAPAPARMNETMPANAPTPEASNPAPSALPGAVPSAGGGSAAAGGAGAREEGAQPALPLDEPAAGAGDPAGAAEVPMPACARDVTEANKASVTAAIDQLFVQGDITAVDRFWGEPYLQHNPIAASGVMAFRSIFSGLINPGSSIYQRSRIIGECELVLIHGNYTSFGGPTFDLFRVEGGRLVEHWDAAATGAGPNGSGHTALDGDSTVRDLEQSGQNEAMVLEFVDRVLIRAQYDASDDYVSPTLIEHAPDGSDGADAYVRRLQDRSLTYRQVHHSIGDGNFVFVLSEGALGATAVAHYDLFRVEGLRIVEHWDARRNVPANTESGLGIF